jgi:hypothetical protein
MRYGDSNRAVHLPNKRLGCLQVPFKVPLEGIGVSRSASGVKSTLASLTQPRHKALSDLLPRGRRHFPFLHRSHPSSKFLAPRRLDIPFRRRF